MGHYQYSQSARLWVGVSAVGRTPGDSANSFFAPGYAKADCGFDLQVGRGTSFGVIAYNLFDRRYVEALTANDDVYQGGRRRVQASIRHAW